MEIPFKRASLLVSKAFYSRQDSQIPGPGLCWASQQVTSDGELYSYSLHITKLLRTRGEALGGNYKAQSTHRDSAND